MGIEENQNNSYGLQELGVLEGPPTTEFETIVRALTRAVATPKATLMFFDDERACLTLRASSGLPPVERTISGIPLSNSVADFIRKSDRTVSLYDISQEFDLKDVLEVRAFGIASCIGTPIHGPAGDPIGVLAAYTTEPHNWTLRDHSEIEDLARLATQYVMLKASFETLRLISRHAALPNGS